MFPGALEGIRVLDLGEMVSAPYCAKLFSDYGAEVVKVELPPGGDAARGCGPFPADQPHPEKSGLFHYLNTNKRGITLDFTRPAGRELLLRLVEKADVLIENHAPRRMREWGLSYEALARVNPRLVVISITPYGQTGPYSEWRGYDLNAFHLSAAGHRYCGRPGEAPLESGTFVADFFGAVAGATWGLAATYGRDRAGGGQQLDVSCAEAIASTFTGAQNIGGFAQDGVFDRRSGVGLAQGAPATVLPCRDGHVWMMALEPGQWNGLGHAMGDPEWMQVDLFQDMGQRAQNADMMYPLLTEWTMQHGKQEIMDLCQSNGCPTTAVYRIDEAVEHPHMKERGYLVELEHPDLGRFRTLGAPFRMPECPGGPRTAAPRLGEHNTDVYGEWLGLGEDRLAALRADGVL